MKKKVPRKKEGKKFPKGQYKKMTIVAIYPVSSNVLDLVLKTHCVLLQPNKPDVRM